MIWGDFGNFSYDKNFRGFYYYIRCGHNADKIIIEEIYRIGYVIVGRSV